MLLFWDADQSETFQDNSFYIYQDTEINSISVSCKKKKRIGSVKYSRMTFLTSKHLSHFYLFFIYFLLYYHCYYKTLSKHQ